MALYPQRVLSIFSGIGGLDLAVKLNFPQSKVVAYIEREAYCQRVLMERMQNKTLDEGVIWDDVTTFEGKPWRGVVDCIIGGFPCTDLSVAGRKEGIKQGNRSGLFYEFIRIAGQIRPKTMFMENVTGLLDNRAMGIVLGELARLGFDAEWGVFSARDVGSTHLRKRVFILAYRNEAGL